MENKYKRTKARKDHVCWLSGKKIFRDEIYLSRKVFPKEAEKEGLIDVCKPIIIRLKCN